MNHGQQSGEAKHEDDAALTEFLASLMDYTPTIPDDLVEHYLAKSGFQCPDVRLIRLVAVATQKFVADVASDALQHCKARPAPVVKDKKQQKDKRLILTMEDLSKALREVPIAIGGPGLSAGVKFRQDIETPELANVLATVMNLHGFVAPSNYESSLIEVVDK